MNDSEAWQKQIEDLRDRLSRLSRASRRIIGDQDLDTVLQDTVDEAHALTGARCGVLAVLDYAGQSAKTGPSVVAMAAARSAAADSSLSGS